MSSEQNAACARRLFEDVISQGRFDLAPSLIADDCVDHNPSPGQAPGRAGITAFFASLRRAFPDWRVRVEALVAEGDLVAARLSAEVTHRGEFFGIPPTGRRLRVRVMDFLRFENGLVVERWGERNDAEILQQLGAMPAAAHG